MVKDIEQLKSRLSIVLARIEKLELQQNGGYTAQVAKSFHLGMVGGSGRNVARLNRRRDAELDRTIDRAVILTKLYTERNGLQKQIEDIESGAVEKRQENAISLRMKRAEMWRNLKPGDELPIGNSNGNPTIKTKNRLSVITTGGTKWTAAEVIGREASRFI